MTQHSGPRTLNRVDATPSVVCPAGFRDRLDKALPALFADLSRGEARRLIAAGSVFVDGQRCRVASRTVSAGMKLRLARETAAPADEATLVILHDEPGFIVVDKPAGMPSAPTRQAAAGSAQDLLSRQLRSAGRPHHLWLVHRLDTATSGVLLFATDRAAAAALGAAFQAGLVRKEYLAVVEGQMPEPSGSIDLALRTDGRRATVDAAGRPAQTDWEVVEQRADTALLRLQPRTGRMHQLRVHLQAVGHPILGDRWYGGPPAPRLLLHAARLTFPHPASQQPVTVESPLPAGFGAAAVPATA